MAVSEHETYVNKNEEDGGMFEVTEVSRCQCGHVDTTAISSKELVGSVLYDAMSSLVLMCINAVAYLNRHDNILDSGDK